MLRSVFPRAHQKYFSLPLLGPITDGFDDWLAASGFTLGSRTLAIHLLPIADKQLRRRGVDEDYDRQQATLHIRETKFYKSRLLPINGEIADEIERYLRVRTRRRLPVSADTPLMWNATRGGRAYTGTGLRYCVQPLLEHCGITTTTGKLPRIHDLRHSFAVNALLRWYREGTEVEAKLPLLATYMGHASVAATHYYLHWIEPLRTAASEKFASHYGQLVVPVPGRKGGQR